MPAASIFIESGSGQATRRGAPFPSRVVLRVFDEMGAWMPGEEVQFALPASLLVPSGRFPGGVFDDTAFTDAEGRAISEVIDADNLLGTWVGTVEVVSNPTVKADFYLTNATPFGVPDILLITDNNEQTAAQYTDYLPVTAWLGDGDWVPVGSASVTMTCPVGTGEFPGGGVSRSVLTGPDGYVTFPPFTASGVTGSFTPIISYPGIPTVNADFTTIDPAVPVALVVYAGNNQSTPPNFLFIQQLVVRVVNGVDAPVAGVDVTFDAPNAGASLVWAAPYTDPVTRTSDASGLATTPSLSANATAGTYFVQVSSPGLPLINIQLTNGGAPPVPDSFALLISEA